MFKKKNKQTSRLHLLRSGKSQNQSSLDSSTTTAVPDDSTDGGLGASQELLLGTQNTVSEDRANRQNKPTFSEVVNSLMPPDIVQAMDESNQESFLDKVKNAGKTTWMIFRQVLEVVEAASPAFPPLQSAAGGLRRILEQCDMMEDAQDDLFRVSQKMLALRLILARYNQSDISTAARDRMNGLANWMESVTKSIEMQPSRNWTGRFLNSSEDREKLAKLLESFTSVIDMYMLDLSVGNGEYLDSIKAKVDDLADNNYLDRLRHVEAASFIAQRDGRCLKGTRCSVIADILDWCTGDLHPPVYWLNGMAGTGKSAIARSVCEHLETAGILGGSFFCSRRASAEEQDIRRIIPTLARQLCRLNSSYKQKLVECLQENLDIVSATVERQLYSLIIKPCRDSVFPAEKPVILVIDALDEGARTDDTARLLEAILNEAAELGIPLKFFVTSRPEHHIRSRFKDPSHSADHATFHLHDIEESIVRADIQLYIMHRIEMIKKNPEYHLSSDWPTKEQTEMLVDRADKLFIYAFTACNYIEGHPLPRLTQVISSSSAPTSRQRLDEIYTLILEEAAKNNEDDPNFKLIIHKCLSTLIFARGTFSLAELAIFIETDAQELQIAAKHLHSLILMPSLEDHHGEVTTLHASFGDYLTDKNRSGKHFILKNDAHFTLLQRCFRILNSELYFNVSKAYTSFKSNKDQGLTLPQNLLYAAGHWSDHVIQEGTLDQSPLITSWIERTLMPKFLSWLEVVSIAEKVREVPDMLQTLRPFVKTMPDIIRFMNDSTHFVLEAEGAISLSTPHIYLSALAFSWEGSMIREMFEPNYSRIAKIECTGLKRSQAWDLCLATGASFSKCIALSPDSTCIASGYADSTVQIWDVLTGQPAAPPLQGHTERVTSVAFSLDGTRIVSGSYDNTVCMWDRSTTNLILGPLQGHTKHVTSVVISPNGAYIASAAYNDTVCIWDANSGNLLMQFAEKNHQAGSVLFSPDGNCVVSAINGSIIHMWNTLIDQPVISPLQGYTDSICVAFSPNSKYIVSGSRDGAVRVWDVQTGQLLIPPLWGHASSVISVAFSPDGTRIASGSQDQTVCIWDALIEQPAIHQLQGNTSGVNYVAFLADSACIVSRAYDGTVRTWDISNNTPVIKALPGHNESVSSVIFSPDGTRIASGSSDCTVRIWDGQTGQPDMSPLRGHTDLVTCVAFSPDGTQIVSGSRDKTVCIWSLSTGQLAISPLQGHTKGVTSVAFSPDGTYIASGSEDCTLRIWNTQTGQIAIEPLQAHTRDVNSVSFSPDGTFIASGSNDFSICIWDVKTGHLVFEPLRGHIGSVTFVVFSPDGGCILSGGYDATICVWNAQNGLLDLQLLHDYSKDGFNQNPDIFPLYGSRVVSQSGDLAIRVWDTKKTQCIGELNSYSHPTKKKVISAFCLPHNRIISITDEVGLRVYLWDLQNCQPILHSFCCPDFNWSNFNSGEFVSITSVGHSMDGTRIVAGLKNTIQVFDCGLFLHPIDNSILNKYIPNKTDGMPTISLYGNNAQDTKLGYKLEDLDAEKSKLVGTTTSPVECYTKSGIGYNDSTRWPSLSPLPFQLSKVPPFPLQSPISDPRDLFTLKDGWIKGPNGELLLWIPKNILTSLYMPRTITIISHNRYHLDLSDFACGEEWIDCKSAHNPPVSNKSDQIPALADPEPSRNHEIHEDLHSQDLYTNIEPAEDSEALPNNQSPLSPWMVFILIPLFVAIVSVFWRP